MHFSKLMDQWKFYCVLWGGAAVAWVAAWAAAASSSWRMRARFARFFWRKITRSRSISAGVELLGEPVLGVGLLGLDAFLHRLVLITAGENKGNEFASTAFFKIYKWLK